MPMPGLNAPTDLASGHNRSYGTAHADSGSEDVRPIGPELHGAFSVLGVVDGIYIVVADMPLGVRLSAGRCNSDFTWSLAPDEIEDLSVIVPDSAEQEFTLTVRVVTPDPDGYDFAWTTAQFNVVVGPGGSAVPFNSLKRIEPLEPRDWPVIVRSAYDRHLSQLGAAITEDPRPTKRRMDAPFEGRRRREPVAAHPAAMAETRQLAAARSEWEAEEAIRLARSHSRWAVEAEEVWRLRANDLARYYEERLSENKTRWRMREAERIAALDASWAARLVAAEARWRAEQLQQAPAKRRPRLGRYRRPIDFCLAV